MGVAASVAIARLGGTGVKGVASAFAAANTLAFTVVNLDLAQQILKDARIGSSQDAIRRRVAALWPWFGGLALLASLVGLLASRQSVIWLAFGTMAYLVSAQLGVAANGVRGPTVTAWGGIWQQGAMIAAALVAWRLDLLDMQGVKVVVILSYLAPLALFWRAAKPNRPTKSGFAGTRLRELIRRGVGWQPARVAQVLLLRLDTLTVFVVLGPSAAGIYSVGLALSALAGIVPAQYAANATFQATQGLSSSLRRNATLALITGSGTAVGLALVGYPLLTVLYGSEFRASFVILLWTLPGVVAYGVLQVFTNAMRISSHPRTVAQPSFAGLVLMSAGLGLLVPAFGSTGAAAASSLGAVGALLFAYFQTRRMRAR